MKIGKSLIFWLAAIVLLTAIANMTGQGTPARSAGSELPFSEFMNQAENNRIAEVTVSGPDVYGTYTDGGKFYTYTPYDPTMIETLRKNNVVVNAKPEDTSANTFWGIVISWFPMILLIGVWIFFMRQANAGNSKAMSFGKSRARLLENSKKVTFADVAGCDESKQELEEVIDFLKDPGKFQRLGGKIPKGVLLVGPPGTGKTLLAKAVAGEADVPFFSISGSDFVEMFVGVGASRVRDMFAQAKKNSPCLLFIDEIDAVGRHRGAGLGGGNDEREQTLNQLLVEMDGFDENENVILIAATNRPDVLDPALLRPGRFDRQVVVPNPDVKGREEILKVHVRKVPLAKDVNLAVVARGTPGFSGADLANLVNEAALLAARRNKRKVTSKDFDDAKDKVLMGNERKSMAMDEQEKKLTAYHEAGHAVVMHALPTHEPVHRITIVPRGHAGGMTISLPDEDHSYQSKRYMEEQIVSLLGGRAAEKLMLGDISTGASNDIERASHIARKMVTAYGMSEKLGSIAFESGHDEVFIGKTMGQTRSYSEKTAAEIDDEVKAIIDRAYARCEEILTARREALTAVAEYLLAHETMTGEEFERMVGEAAE